MKRTVKVMSPWNTVQASATGTFKMPRPAELRRQAIGRPAEALRRLGVDRAQLEEAPKISIILKALSGGFMSYLDAMRFSQEEVVRIFLQKYDSVPSEDRRKLPLEAIALSAGVSLTELLGAALMAIQKCNVDVVKAIAISNHPEVIRKRVEYAKMPGGYRDRGALDTAMGFLPTSKGITFLNNVTTAKPKEDEEDEAPQMIDADVDYLFPPVVQMQKRVEPIRAGLLGEGE